MVLLSLWRGVTMTGTQRCEGKPVLSLKPLRIQCILWTDVESVTLCGFCVHSTEAQEEFDELFSRKHVMTLCWSREHLYKGEAGFTQREYSTDKWISEDRVCLQNTGSIYPLDSLHCKKKIILTVKNATVKKCYLVNKDFVLYSGNYCNRTFISCNFTVKYQ